MPTVIVHERLKGNPQFLANCTFLKGVDVKFAACVPFDMCFNNTGQPSIFIALFGVREQLADLIVRLTKMQNMSRLCFAMGAVKDDGDSSWSHLNNALPSGQLRLIRTQGDSNIIFPRLIESIVSSLSNVEKLDLQSDFFAKSERSLVSTEKVKSVLAETFSKLQVPQEDGALVLEGLGQIRHIVSAKLDLLSSNVPVDINTLSSISTFFGQQ